MNHQNNNRNAGDGPTREDILIGRIADAEATPNDWAEIEAIAETDPAVWHRLAAAQRTHARVESAVEDAIAIAELIDVPDLRAVHRPVIARIREYSGWALAAGLALALIVTMMNPGGFARSAPTQLVENPGTNNGPGLAQFPSIGDQGDQPGALMVNNNARPSYDQYLLEGYKNGYIVQELAPALHEARALPTGGYEIIITRGHVERRKVTDLNAFRVQSDEWGREHLVPDENGATTIPVRQIY